MIYIVIYHRWHGPDEIRKKINNVVRPPSLGVWKPYSWKSELEALYRYDCYSVTFGFYIKYLTCTILFILTLTNLQVCPRLQIIRTAFHLQCYLKFQWNNISLALRDTTILLVRYYLLYLSMLRSDKQCQKMHWTCCITIDPSSFIQHSTGFALEALFGSSFIPHSTGFALEALFGSSFIPHSTGFALEALFGSSFIPHSTGFALEALFGSSFIPHSTGFALEALFGSSFIPHSTGFALEALFGSSFIPHSTGFALEALFGSISCYSI